MKRRELGAERIESCYLSELKNSLSHLEDKDANEIVQNVREFIEKALAESSSCQISEEEMEAVLNRIGPAQDILKNTERQLFKKPLRKKLIRCKLTFLSFFLLLNLAGVVGIIWQLERFNKPTKHLNLEKYAPSGTILSNDATEILLNFNLAIDPASVKPDTVQLSPQIKGKTHYAGEKTLKFKLGERLKNATRYRIFLSTDLRGIGGEIPSQGYWHFNTTPLKVEDVTQTRIENNGSYVLTMRFNDSVNPFELQDYLEMSYPDKKPVLYKPVSGKPDKNLMVSLPYSNWDKVQVTIRKGLTGVNGPLALENDYQADVFVSRKLKFIKMIPSYKDDSASIEVHLNSPVDITNSTSLVSVNPHIKYTFDPSYNGFNITGDFIPGTRYLVTLSPGIKGGAAGTLEKEIVRAVWFPDKPEMVRFSFGSGYLSPRSPLKIAVRSVNTEKVRLDVKRLFPNNIVEQELDSQNYIKTMLTEDVSETSFDLSKKRNEEVETLLDLNSIIGQKVKGVFGLWLKGKKYWQTDHATIIVTDLGITAYAAEKEVLIWINSIQSSLPEKGVQIQLFNDRRQMIGQGITDEAGIAVIPLNKDEKLNPVLLIASKEDDLSFLNFSGNARRQDCLTGRPYLSDGYEIFTTTERGVYRAGDIVKLSAFIRDKLLNPPSSLPVDIRVIKPNGKELEKQTVMSEENGRILCEYRLPENVPNGRYRVQYSLPGEKTNVLGNTFFLIADYVPETLRMQLEADHGPLLASERFVINTQTDYLFGEPAKGLNSSCRVSYKSGVFSPKGWESFHFGDSRKPMRSQDISLPQTRLNEEGKTLFSLNIPSLNSPAVIEGNFEIEVQEAGGRTVLEKLKRSFHLFNGYLGLQFPKNQLQSGKETLIKLACISYKSDLYEKEGPFQWTLYRVTYQNVLRKSAEGRLRYEWTSQENIIETGQGNFFKGQADISFVIDHPGMYRIVAESEELCTVSYDFSVYGKGMNWFSEHPDRLVLSLDKKSYSVGDTARLSVLAPFCGKALVCVKQDKILETKILDIKNSSSFLDFVVQEKWRPNAYITVTLIRPVKSEENWNPHRASGEIALLVDSSDRKIPLLIETNDKAKPGEEIEVSVKIAGENASPGIPVVLMAVDEGVLSLTSFKTPSPLDYFYKTRRLTIKAYDIYERLSPLLTAWSLSKNEEPGGGDSGYLEELGRRLPSVTADRIKTAVLYAGTLTTDSQGIAKAKFTIPEYLGELRIMAMAANGNSFGDAEKKLTVSSPVMARVSWPRFLAPGDSFYLPVSVFNRTGSDDKFSISFDIEGPVELLKKPGDLFIADQKENTVQCSFQATSIGESRIRIIVKSSSEAYQESVEIPIRPKTSFSRSFSTEIITEDEEKVLTLKGDYLNGTEKSSIVIGGSPLIELSPLIQSLLQYPYGCLEQVVSKLIPLLYFKDLCQFFDPQLIEDCDIQEMLDSGFQHLSMLQNYNGGLSMWQGESESYPYGSVYAADFLIEAKKGGKEVPESLLKSLLNYISTQIPNWIRLRDNHGNPLKIGEAAYGCYILARAGTYPYEWLSALEEELIALKKSGKYVPASAYFHLAGAFLAMGQTDGALLLAGETYPLSNIREQSGYLDSPIRESAILLSILLDLDKNNPKVHPLVMRLKQAVSSSAVFSTQENAFVLMALGKYARLFNEPCEMLVSLTLPNGSKEQFKGDRLYSLKNVKPGQSFKISVTGKGKLYAFLYSEGIPLKEEVEEKDSGFSVRREIFETDGITLANTSSLKQGNLYIVRLAIETNRTLNQLAILDLLPACFEIEDPQLKSVSIINPEKPSLSKLFPFHIERKDDRLIIFSNLNGNTSEYRYLVRCVTAGEFGMPPLDAVCMYDAGLFSVNGKRILKVQRSDSDAR